jgi:hypothetical protein
MIRRSLPVFLSLLFVLPVAAGTSAQDLRVAGSNEEQAPAGKSNDGKTPDSKPPEGKIPAGRIAVSRSDGSTGHAKLPDQKEIRKLVGYMRDGMNRADKADSRDRQSKRAIQYRRIWIKK